MRIEDRGIGGSLALHRVRRGASALLHHVRQLVSDQPAADARARRVLAGAEDYRVAERKGAGVDRARQLAGGRSGMQPHAGEIAPEARLEESALGGGQRLAAALKSGEAPLEAAGDARRL